MAITGDFKVMDYSYSNGGFYIHLINYAPGPGNPNDYYILIPDAEIPTNINQSNLNNVIKKYVGWTYNQTYTPLNTAVANGMIVTQP